MPGDLRLSAYRLQNEIVFAKVADIDTVQRDGVGAAPDHDVIDHLLHVVLAEVATLMALTALRSMSSLPLAALKNRTTSCPN
ncbi:MAG: hypothetical protein HRU31_18855, partial [Rhodobacteraceae bacterium]|nr:hypothetical protein [Paracoccaceae bacterium]